MEDKDEAPLEFVSFHRVADSFPRMRPSAAKSQDRSRSGYAQIPAWLSVPSENGYLHGEPENLQNSNSSTLRAIFLPPVPTLQDRTFSRWKSWYLRCKVKFGDREFRGVLTHARHRPSAIHAPRTKSPAVRILRVRLY